MGKEKSTSDRLKSMERKLNKLYAPLKTKRQPNAWNMYVKANAKAKMRKYGENKLTSEILSELGKEYRRKK
jgi:ABC-type Fe3+-citrate transport system substrate-binding protein